MSEILAKEYRGNVVENVHRGSIAVVSSTGDTIAYLGDIEKQTFLRSASKPIQVLPTLLAGLHKKYNLTDEEVAMFNSSHWGSNHHIFVLEEISRKTGINPEDMIMKPCGSASASALASKLTDQSRLHPRQGISKLQHCCSGKHFSLMLLQRELTGKVSGYEQKDSPVQKQIINFISMLSQTPTFKIGLGIDGCGVPVFALPLRSIAMCYARLVNPFSLSNELRETIDYNFSCIHSHPEKINDYGTPSYYINRNPDLIMKDGSRGVICMAIKSMKLGIAVKLEDGWTDEFQGLIIANILEQLKYDNNDLIEKLRNCYSQKLYNDCGIEVGHSEVEFKLDIDSSFFESPEEYADADNDDDNDNYYDSLSDSAFSTAGDMPSGSDFQSQVDLSSGSEFQSEGDMPSDGEFLSDSSFSSGLYDDYSGSPDSGDDTDVPVSAGQITDEEETELTEEDLRDLRNRKSILGMTVVKPSKGHTVISNPRVDPISAGPGIRADRQSTDSPNPEIYDEDGNRNNYIKTANIISQRKRKE